MNQRRGQQPLKALLLGTIAALLITGCAAKGGDDTAVLAQLEALQQDVAAMKGDVAVIKQAVTDLHREILAAAPSGPVAPETVGPVSMGNHQMLGNAAAQIAIVEFTDFQCPFCARYHSQTFPDVKKNYVDTGKAQYVVRDFPLPFHEQAVGAAIAVNCAGEQGKYWDMYPQVFANQARLGDALYQDLARRIGLDPAQFSECLTNPLQEELVASDVAAGRGAGVQGTPSFFIGRIEHGLVVDAEMVVGAQPFPAFAAILDRLTNP